MMIITFNFFALEVVGIDNQIVSISIANPPFVSIKNIPSFLFLHICLDLCGIGADFLLSQCPTPNFFKLQQVGKVLIFLLFCRQFLYCFAAEWCLQQDKKCNAGIIGCDSS